MKIISKLFIVATLAVIIVGCGSGRTRNEKVSAMINKINSPFVVASLMPQNIIDKSGAKEDGVLPYTYKTLSTFFLDANETGVDNNTKIQLIAGEGTGLGPDVYGIFKIIDEIKFKDMAEKEFSAKIKEKDGINYFIKDKENYVIVWNEEFAIVSNVPFNLAAMFSGGGNEAETTVSRCINIIKAGEEGEVNELYKDFLAKDADVSTLFESAGFVDFLAGFGVIKKGDVEDMQKQYSGNSMQSFLNFEKGKITWKHEFDLIPELKKKFDFVGDKGISKGLFSYGNSKNPLFKYALNVETKGLLDYMENEMPAGDFSEFVEELEERGFSVDDLINTFSGEMLFIVDKVNVEKKMIDYGYGEPFMELTPSPVVGIAIAIKDKAAFAKLAENSEVSPNGVIRLDNNFYATVTDDVFFVSTDTAWVTSVLSGAVSDIARNSDNLTNEPFGFYTDFANNDKANFEALDIPIADILVNAYGFVNLSGAEITIELNDKSQNALQLVTKIVSDKIVEEDEYVNQEMKNIIDQEILEGLNEGIEEVANETEKIIGEVEGELGKSLDGLFNELEKGVDQITTDKK
jgi:hypothetical protein